MVKRPQDHEWSSYRNYAGLAAAPSWLTQSLVLIIINCGPDRNIIRFIPSLTISDAELNQALKIIGEALDTVSCEVKSLEHLTHSPAVCTLILL